MTRGQVRSGELVFIDYTYDLMREACEEALEGVWALDEVRLRQILAETGWDQPREEIGEAAWNELVVIETKLENIAYSIAQRFSSAEWLWYLRRIEWFFDEINELPSTGPYVLALAESIAAMSASPSRSILSDSTFVQLPIDDQIATSVMRLATLAVQIYQTHSALRWAGKGARICSEPTRLPFAQPTPELDAMTRLWDRRMANYEARSFLDYAGLVSPTVSHPPKPADAVGMVPVVGRAADGTYGLTWLNLGAVPTLSDEELPIELRWPTERLDLIALLWATLWGDYLGQDNHQALLTLRKAGYRVMKRQRALVELDHAMAGLRLTRLGGALPESVTWGSPDVILERLRWADVSIWPPTHGPAVHLADDWVFVDLTSATGRVRTALSRPKLEGSLANLWSAHFERAVQDAIDVSPWKPSPTIAALRRRPLRANGAWITDIDAIGELGDRLLLVSAKCLPFSQAWDRGEYNTVLAISQKVEEAVVEWADRVGKLRTWRVGDNQTYDFSAYREIIGVAVVPSVPWTANPDAVAEVVPGLRAAVSVGELEQWMAGRQSRTPQA